MSEKVIKYKFIFSPEESVDYELKFDRETLKYKRDFDITHPNWCVLEFQKCKNCPLKKEEYTYCPVAANIHEVADYFKNKISYDEVVVRIETEERTYSKNTDIQSGLFSIFGAVMATSGCPHLDFLRPLVHFHLPFASIEESLFRFMSLYLVKQYFRERKGKKGDFNLEGLHKQYAEVEKVNEGLMQRVRHITSGDAGGNAIVALNIFAQMMQTEINNDMDSLEFLFEE